jgi:hypothetical protein
LQITRETVSDLLRFKGKIRYLHRGQWRSKATTIVKDDGASENYVSRRFVEALREGGADIAIENAGWMVVETANAHNTDEVEQRQRAKLRLHIGSYQYETSFTIYDVKSFDIVLGKRWMRDINGRHHIDHDANEMWISDRPWEDRHNGRIHDLPGLCPQDVGDVKEQARLMGIEIVQQDELRAMSSRLLKNAFFVRVHHVVEPRPPDDMADMLRQFEAKGLFDEPTFDNARDGGHQETVG